jgi:hypothetical protein
MDSVCLVNPKYSILFTGPSLFFSSNWNSLSVTNTVHYSKCNNIISIIQTLGEHAKIGKIDIKSAFQPVPCYPGDFDLLGCIIGYMYYNQYPYG